MQHPKARRLIAGLAIAVLGCTSGPPAGDPRPNFVVFLIDALRADHVGAYGYERDTTPFVDVLAARGMLFENAISQAPWTAPSMASIWTSRYPSEVGVRAVEDAQGIRGRERLWATAMREDAVTLAGLLAGRGYETLAVTHNVYASERFGLLRGFEHTVYERERGSADRAVDAALGLLDEHADGERPFFLYVHLMDVHEPTRPPAPYLDMYPTLDGEPHVERHFRWSFGRGRDLDGQAFATYRSHKLALYDGALRFVDDQIARFAAELERRGEWESTVVVVASDHGEEFWENVAFQMRHNLDPRGIYGIGHGHSMSRELLRVPLVIGGPGVPRARVSGQVRNLDIAPSLLGLAGIDPAPEMRGVDVVSAVAAGRLEPLIALSEQIAYGAEQKSVQTQRRQYVRYARARTPRTEFLFAKAAEGERMSIVERRSGGGRLRRFAGSLLAPLQAAAPGGTVVPDAATVEALRALGYTD